MPSSLLTSSNALGGFSLLLMLLEASLFPFQPASIQCDVDPACVPIELSSTQCGVDPAYVPIELSSTQCGVGWSSVCPHRAILNPA